MKFHSTDIAITSSASYSNPFTVNPSAGGAAMSRPGTVTFEVYNSGAAALTTCVLQVKAHPDGEFQDFLGGTDWTSSSVWSMLHSSVALGTLAAGARGLAHVRIHAAYQFRFKFTTGTTTTVSVRGSLNSGQ